MYKYVIINMRCIWTYSWWEVEFIFVNKGEIYVLEFIIMSDFYVIKRDVNVVIC